MDGTVERRGDLLFQIWTETIYIDKQRNRNHNEQKDADDYPGDNKQTLHGEMLSETSYIDVVDMAGGLLEHYVSMKIAGIGKTKP